MKKYLYPVFFLLVISFSYCTKSASVTAEEEHGVFLCGVETDATTGKGVATIWKNGIASL